MKIVKNSNLANRKVFMECKYHKIEDVTSWHGDIFDHPDYKYYCTRQDKTKEIFSWTCLYCPFYKEKD